MADTPGAKINRTELAKNAEGNGDGGGDVLVTRRERTAPIGLLQSKARALGAYDVEQIIGKFDPDRITMRQMRQMRRDPLINLGLHYRKATLMNARWHMECVDPVVRAFATECLRAIYNRLIPQMCLRDAFGRVPIVQRFQREVPTWQYEDPVSKEMKDVWPEKNIPAVTWNNFQALPPEGAHPEFSDDERTFIGFKHDNLSATKEGPGPLRVPATHALWVTRNYDEEFGNWYGYPLTGHAFRYWWSYWYQWLLADHHMETDADPPIRVDYPPGTSFDPDEPGQKIDNYQVALRAGQLIRDGATVAIPSDYYENVGGDNTLVRGARKWEMDYMKGGENIDAFHKSFAYLDTAKLLALLVPPQSVSGAKGTLSGNVAETYATAMTQSMTVEMAQLDQAINDYMLPRLLEQNFVDPPKCVKVTDGFREEEIALGIDLIKAVAASDPGGLQVNWRELARQVGHLPLLDAEQIKKIQEEDAKKMEQQQKLATNPVKDQPTAPNQHDNPRNKPRTKDAKGGA